MDNGIAPCCWSAIRRLLYPQKRTWFWHDGDVRFVPKPDIRLCNKSLRLGVGRQTSLFQSREGFSNSSMIWSTVKLAARWLGGNSLKVARKFAT
jgi:hypothetical protein